MAYTKDEFYQAALNELSNYEVLAERVQIGDVTITQPMAAIAHMLAMLSVQSDLGLTEYWTRARDSFVLADSAARQILPFGSPKVFRLTARNDAAQDFTISTGRRLLDQRSRVWVVREGMTVPAHGTADLTVTQYSEMSFTHTINEYRSFYRIAIPEPEANQCLIGLILTKNSNNREFAHTEKFNNVDYGDYVYHIMGDEYLNLFIQFGLKGKAGYVPTIGEQFTVTLRQSYVDFAIEQGSQFALEYALDHEENLSFFATEEIQAGTGVASISELRELVKYPYLYDENAVFLGEFTQLVFRKMRPFIFLSIWNEYLEESVRGPSLQNINTLFVSFIKDNITVEEAQNQIKKTIQAADNSYKIKFVDNKEIKIGFSVQLWLSPLHDSAAVQQKVRMWVLDQFGRLSTWARRGRQRINLSDVTKSMKESISELNDGTSDVVITVTDPDVNFPEAFRYVSNDSLSITSTGIASD